MHPQSEAASIFGALAQAFAGDWRALARPNQLPPADPWTIWLLLAGRGFGKTRTGAEWVRSQVETGQARRIALVAATAADVRDTVIEGESGLLAIAPAWNRPIYEPSKRRLTWPNGAIATAFSADEPDRLRGPQHDAAWCDEIAAWRYPETWDQLMFGLRLGRDPRCVVTTTPKPTKLVRDLLKREGKDVRVTRGTSYDNRENLAPAFFAQIVSRYEGTRLGRQELNAELLDDVPGALWTRESIDRFRTAGVPEFTRIVVAIDPAVTSGDDADETGIVAVGLGEDGHGYVIDDKSMKASPLDWARQAIALYYRRKADRIVAEVNQGGDLVEATIRMVDPNASFKAVRATRGKVVRAEPVAALYEQGRVHHVGAFPVLEDQLCGFTSDFDRSAAGYSPDRLDALVWAITELMVGEPVDGAGLFEYYRRMAEGVETRKLELKGDAVARVKIEAPEGFASSHVSVRSGLMHMIGPDRSIMANEDDAAPLLAQGWRRAPAAPEAGETDTVPMSEVAHGR